MSTINILLEERIKELQANVNQLLDVEQELKSARQELESCKKLLHLRSSTSTEEEEEKPVLERLKEVIPDVDPSIQERQPADLIDMHISLDSDSEAWDYVN